MKKKNLTIEETFALAVQNHKENNLQVAENLYKKILKTNPNYAGVYYNLGITYKELEDYQKAINCYKNSIQIEQSFYLNKNGKEITNPINKFFNNFCTTSGLFVLKK